MSRTLLRTASLLAVSLLCACGASTPSPTAPVTSTPNPLDARSGAGPAQPVAPSFSLPATLASSACPAPSFGSSVRNLTVAINGGTPLSVESLTSSTAVVNGSSRQTVGITFPPNETGSQAVANWYRTGAAYPVSVACNGATLAALTGCLVTSLTLSPPSASGVTETVKFSCATS